ncbi:MAG TPA: PAAR domain-containing protein [Sphingomonas sanguinis]|uniref:PAAR domain-containing protein n=1 Tax=Sphingomonas sanguinis TaxID=33051 RepID=UPI002AC263C3|nr:PAAR domain-containing protein [Sphingomonas sanguinis]
MVMEPAARVEDEIAHGFGMMGMVGGALVGVAAGVAVVTAISLTGGLAGVVIAGAVAGGGLAGDQIVSGLETIFDLPEPTTGALAIGSHNVFVNSRAAICAEFSSASGCTGLPLNHPPWFGSILVREGSATVLINGQPASRLKSMLTCGAHIKTASPNVIIGGKTICTGLIFDLESWTRTGLQILGIGALVGGGVFAAMAGAAAFGSFAAVGLLGFAGMEGVGMIGDAIGPGYRDLLQGLVGMGMVVAGPKLAKVGRNLAIADDTRPQTERDLAEMMQRAPAAKQEIDGIADDIATKVGGRVAKAPIKSEARALEKINNDYDGDASRIKDLARNTIIVPKERIPDATAMLRDRGVTIKEITPSQESLGYSGINGTMKTQSGITGEIQVNSPEMIYAKESPANARAILGDETYNDIANRVGVPGGRGHALYEDYRSLPPSDPTREGIAQESMEYYDHVRGR